MGQLGGPTGINDKYACCPRHHSVEAGTLGTLPPYFRRHFFFPLPIGRNVPQSSVSEVLANQKFQPHDTLKIMSLCSELFPSLKAVPPCLLQYIPSQSYQDPGLGTVGTSTVVLSK